MNNAIVLITTSILMVNKYIESLIEIKKKYNAILISTLRG
jgi:hypothetical protein